MVNRTKLTNKTDIYKRAHARTREVSPYFLLKKNSLCLELAQARTNFASSTTNKHFFAMKNTEYDLTKLASMISTASSLKALLEMMGDMGLEMDSAVMGD